MQFDRKFNLYLETKTKKAAALKLGNKEATEIRNYFYKNKMKTKSVKNNLFIFLAVLTLPLLVVGVVKADEEGIENQIINYANQERAKQGLEQLSESDILDEVAELKAQDMLNNNYFAHTSPEGVDPWYWFDKVGYPYRFAGENLGMDFNTAIAVHEAWMDSEAHRDNILSNKYEEIGVAVKKGIIDNKETQIAVQVFGSSLRDDEVPVGSSGTLNEEVKEENGVLITQSSLHFWKGEEEDEILVSAEIKGEPVEVSAVVGSQEYELEKLRDNIYVNLISVDIYDLKEESVLIKATGEEQQTVFGKVPDKYFAEYLIEKDDQEEEDNKVVAMLTSDSDNNELIDTARTWFNQTGLMLLIVGLLIITILNIWILEREEERLLETKNA